MSAATTREKRAWAVEHGWPELKGGSGKLPPEALAAWDVAHDDYAPGVGAADFITADDDLEDPAEPPGAGGDTGNGWASPPSGGHEEERPGRPGRGRRWRSLGSRRRGRGQDGGGDSRGGGRARKVFARVSIAPLIEDAYADVAWAAGGIPPLAKLLRAQAPIAGVVLDPAVKDTFIDRGFLQPAARNHELAKMGMAFLGTPASLMSVLATAPQPTDKLVPAINPDGTPALNPEGQPVMVMGWEEPSPQHKMSMVTLRYCVRAMADVAGDSMKRVAKRAEEAATRDEVVDDFIAWLLDIPRPGPDDEASAQSEARDAALRLAGAPGD